VNKCRCWIAYKEIAAAVTEELVVLAIFSGDFEKKCRQWFWQFLVGRLLNTQFCLSYQYYLSYYF
jgi:hypothetical protein